MATRFHPSRSFPRHPIALEDAARDPRFEAAFKAAVKAERAAHPGACPPRRRIAFLLCELGTRLGPDASFRVDRARLADALGIGLGKVKRVLALFALSRDIAPDLHRIRVIDWRRLCSAAGYEGTGLAPSEEEDEIVAIPRREEEAEPQLTTMSGEPAFFG
ncbi:MAG: hypothetical protein ACK4K7_10465 [Allosphingosinicella sp.]|uniref:hypothetical protein n=1 Tax=Allosphingosinicella sp. TaxID=2823234 RepID=UPI00392381CE